MKEVFLFLLYVGLVVELCFSQGCLKPGYKSFAEDMCKKLDLADQDHRALKWATDQIRSENPPDGPRPRTNSIAKLPDWVKEINPYSAQGSVIYAPTPQNDQVLVSWISGRGVWGFIVGGSNCAPALSEDVYYFCKCKPGVYTFHSRSDY
jgi:hypothetical protein